MVAGRNLTRSPGKIAADYSSQPDRDLAFRWVLPRLLPTKCRWKYHPIRSVMLEAQPPIEF